MQMSSDKKDAKIIQNNISAAFLSKKNGSVGISNAGQLL
jgi:hypothetical protein